MKKLKLTELIDTKVLQEMQDALSEYTGLAALTTDADGVPITEGSGFTEFCTKFTRKTTLGVKRCMECDKTGAFQAFDMKQPCVYRCHAGLIDFAAPIIVEDTVIGSVIGGQILPDDLTDEALIKTAKQLGLDPIEYITAAAGTHRRKMSDVESAAQFLYRIANVFSRMAYRSYAAIEDSRRMENAANARSQYILSLANDLKINISDWTKHVEDIKASSDGDEAAYAVEKLSVSGSRAYSIVNDTIDYIQLMGSETEFKEQVYNVRLLARQLIEDFMKLSPSTRFSAGIEDSVPEKLYGDENHIRMIIEKLFSECRKICIDDVSLMITSQKSDYAQVLEIRLAMVSRSVTEEILHKIRFYLDSTNDDYDKKQDMSMYGFSVIGSFIRKLSGSIDIEADKDGIFAFVIQLPQLMIKGA